MSNNANGFMGCTSSYEEAKIVIYGAPFDNTTSYRPGTRFGSSAIRSESFGIEDYSVYQDLSLSDFKIHDAFDIELPFG
ncbi:MAG: arginase family protein, partial [Clostridia bacterium]|nr:arginase family protein [Clostridia bacterium]